MAARSAVLTIPERGGSAAQVLRSWLAEARVRIRIGTDALAGVLETGHFLNMHSDPGVPERMAARAKNPPTDHPLLTPEQIRENVRLYRRRLAAEKRYFGKVTPRSPIYGYLYAPPQITGAASSAFGRHIVQLKQSVAKRTTFTLGHVGGLGNPPGVRRGVPSPVLEPSLRSIPSNIDLRRYARAGDLSLFYGLEFEAQIVGGVKVTDIERVLLELVPGSDDAKAVRALEKQLEARGVRVETTSWLWGDELDDYEHDDGS